MNRDDSWEMAEKSEFFGCIKECRSQIESLDRIRIEVGDVSLSYLDGIFTDDSRLIRTAKEDVMNRLDHLSGKLSSLERKLCDAMNMYDSTEALLLDRISSVKHREAES
jgi:hypothetical protein